MEVNAIAWMMAGGVRAEALENQRQRQQRAELADLTPGAGDRLGQFRSRIAVVVGRRAMGLAASASVSADCCPA